MTLELVGLPCTGKTTFAKKLEEGGRWKRVKLRGRLELLWYGALFELFHPIRACRELLWLWRYRGARRTWYTKLINLYLVHNAKWMKARRMEEAIIDQGHLENVVSLFDERVSAETISSYVRILPKPDHVLVFTAPEDVIKKRIQERKYGVREWMKEEEREEWLAAARGHIEALISVLHSSGTAFEVVSGGGEAALKRFSASTAIYYVHPTRMPTERAHGGQIARMCTEWAALGARVTLMAGFRDDALSGGDVARYYGVEKNFSVRFIALTSLHGTLQGMPKFAYFLNTLRVFLRLLSFTPEKGAIIFTRRPELAWLFVRKGVKVVYECHEWYARGWRLPFWMVRNVSLIVTINRYTGDEFIRRGFPKERLTTETNGVLYDAFALPLSPKEAREKIGLPKEWKLMLYTGGLKMMGEDKGVTTILESLVDLKDNSNIHFVAVGGKSGEIEEFKGKAEKLGVLPQCKFIERKTRDELALYQRAADALLIVHPRTHLFEYYMAPLKTFEYMASGRPIIASDLLSLREIMDEDTAFWVKPGNARDLAERMKEILANSAEAERRAQRVQSKAKNFTWHSRAERLLALFRKLT